MLGLKLNHVSKRGYWWISFDFTDIIHLVRPIQGTGNGYRSSLNMSVLNMITDFLIVVIPEAIFQWYIWNTKQTN